jgi:hypothetical protein
MLDMLFNKKKVLVVPLFSFLPSVRCLEFPLFDGCAGALLNLHWRVMVLCALWGVGLLASSE